MRENFTSAIWISQKESSSNAPSHKQENVSQSQSTTMRAVSTRREGETEGSTSEQEQEKAGCPIDVKFPDKGQSSTQITPVQEGPVGWKNTGSGAWVYSCRVLRAAQREGAVSEAYSGLVCGA